jgi:TM2 domain-containing membrane protein YozV
LNPEPPNLFYWMPESNDQNNIPTPPPLKEPVSVHRAFIYSASAPGWGDIYAGSRLRGYATLFFFLFCAAWFTWTLTQILTALVGQFFDSLEGITSLVMPDLPIVSMGFSFFGIYFTWLWGMLSAVDTATGRRQQSGDSPQASVGWAVAISWFCPGSGQIYTSERRFGFILFGAYLLGFLLIVPAYQQLFLSLTDLAKNGQLPNDPYAIIGIVHELIVRLEYSFGKIFQESIKYFAVAGTMAALRQGPLKADTKWLNPSLAYGSALFGLGWLCPGSGQLLQGRYRIGWRFLAGYFGSKFLIVLLLGGDFISVETADTLAWLSVAVQWGSMIEAPLAMRKSIRSDSD